MLDAYRAHIYLKRKVTLHFSILNILFTYLTMYGLSPNSCADPECFAIGGPTLTTFLFFIYFFFGGGGGGGSIYILLRAGYHRPISETPFNWRFASGPMIAQH